MITNKEYLENPAVSQSMLKKLLQHPAYFLSPGGIREGENVRIGDAVDCILTQGDEAFKENFIIKDIVSPSSGTQMAKIADCIIRTVKTSGITKESFNWEKTLRDCFPSIESKRGTVDEFVARFPAEALDYVKYQLWKDESILSQEEYKKVNTVVDSLRDSQFTFHLFDPPFEFQKAFYFDYKKGHVEHKCKILLDIFYKDDILKVIYPKDLKITSFNIYGWREQFLNLKYGYQAAFYTLGLKILFPDYIIADFEFVVESTKRSGSPLSFRVDEELLDIYTNGGKIRGEEVIGVHELLDDLFWHQETHQWSYKRKDYERGYHLLKF